MRIKFVPASELTTGSLLASDYVDPPRCQHHVRFDKLKSQGAIGSMAPDADGGAKYLLSLVCKCDWCGAIGTTIVELDPMKMVWGPTPKRRRAR